MALTPGILARGPWPPDHVAARWSEQPYEPPSDANEAADAAIAALRERGSPAHDGLSARLAAHREEAGGLVLELEPARWALRLNAGDASQSLTAMCVVRAGDGRWLAGRRAPWLATWAGRWALGAGGAVDAGENPAHTLERELAEEWSGRIVVPRQTIRFYLTNNIHYLLDDACLRGLDAFYRLAAECGALPPAPPLTLL